MKHLNRMLELRPWASPEVTIIYENFTSGLTAKRLFDDLFAPLGANGGYRLNMWKINVLRLKVLRAQAVREAVDAAIVCVSVRAEAEFPPWMEEWSSQWAAQRSDRPCAFVVLLCQTINTSARPGPGIRLLRQAARRRRARFFFGLIPPASKAMPAFSLNPTLVHEYAHA